MSNSRFLVMILLTAMILVGGCSSGREPPPECKGDAFALNAEKWTPPPQAELERLCR